MTTFPVAEAPYYRVRFAATTEPGELKFAVNYTVWIPENVRVLRGVVVHQHGCGEGSCSSGLTGAFDLHWQALARAHDCALLSPAYEQPQAADCQLWCDPRNGSADAFQKGLDVLGKQAGHPELATVPWALWGHSGGGHWAGGMVMLHPDRVAAAWLRSGVPLYESNPERESIKPHVLPDAALDVPIMCNPGTKEGVTVKDGRFAKVWPANEKFFYPTRAKGGLIGIAVDPLTAHECGNQRYMAIRWLDACLTARLPKQSGPTPKSMPLNPMPSNDVWLADVLSKEAVRRRTTKAIGRKQFGFPMNRSRRLGCNTFKDTAVADTTLPPAPTKVTIDDNRLRWSANADLESGVSHFIIRRDGKFLSKYPQKPKNNYGRPLFKTCCTATRLHNRWCQWNSLIPTSSRERSTLTK